MKKLILKFSLATLLLLPLTSTNALLLEEDWSYYPYDNNLLTYDTDTGLYWLDLSVTAGLSFVEVENLILDGTLGDFTHASLSQVHDFHTNAGLNHPLHTTGVDEVTLAANFASLIGVTPSLQHGFEINGMTSAIWGTQQPPPNNFHIIESVLITMSSNIPESYWEYYYDAYAYNIADTWSQSNISHYLVATAVPEPSTLLLLGAGIIGIGITRLRKNKIVP